MPTYQRFIFDSYNLDIPSRTIELRYSLDDKVKFTEKFYLPKDIPLDFDHPDLDAALFALHLSGGASYYKTFCPKIIEIRSGKLDSSQAEFWNKLYTHGLGQFFYENKIDFRGLINFPAELKSLVNKLPETADNQPKKVLVPFGGGKDSIVTSEILRAAGIDQTLFRLRPHKIITQLSTTAKLPLLEIHRTLAPELFELNKSGALNGHVPITAHISFLSVVIGILGGFDSVFFSNERSSSYGNVDYLGMEVNHQWSKSLVAENMLRAYIKDYVASDFSYLNILRPLSELQIAKVFVTHPEYFPAATSCNRNWTLLEQVESAPRWCGTCPKCAFSFALLSAFLPANKVIDIFQQDLFANAELLPLYRELWGTEGFKPFECVGTPDEAQAALYLASIINPKDHRVIPAEFARLVLPSLPDPEKLVSDLLTPDLASSSSETKTILERGGVL